MKDPFAAINAKCNSGSNSKKFAAVGDFPDVVDVELTNKCRLRREMCPNGRGELTRKKGFMRNNLFFKIVKELAPRKTPIRLVGYGEPMLHGDFWYLVGIAKKNGLMVHANSSGHHFYKDTVAVCNHYCLDSMKISIHNESDKVKYAVKTLPSLVDTFTSVSITEDEEGHYIWDTAECDAKFKCKTFRPGMDAPRLPNCPEVYNKLTVRWNGKVSACCADWDDMMIIGDLKDNTLSEIWRGKKMRGYQKLIAENRHRNLPLCKNCYDLSLDK